MPNMTEKQKRDAFLQLINYGDAAKTDVNVVNSIIKSRLEYIPNKKLYKFRECNDRNFKTLESNCIWMAPASTFPDLFDNTLNIDLQHNETELNEWIRKNFNELCLTLAEGLYSDKVAPVSLSHSILLKYFDTCIDVSGNPIADKEKLFLCKNIPETEIPRISRELYQLNFIRKRFEEMEEQTEKILSDIINQMRNRPRDTSLTYCLTERCYNNVLWENYAKIYSGFCIEYDFSKYYEAPFDYYKNLVFLFPMTYCATKPTFNMVPIAKNALADMMHDSETKLYDDEVQVDLNMQLYYKNEDYGYEREWRFSISNRASDSSNLQYFPFASAIYAGKDIDRDNLNRLIGISKKLDIPIYKQKMNEAHNGFAYIPVKEVPNEL